MGSVGYIRMGTTVTLHLTISGLLLTLFAESFSRHALFTKCGYLTDRYIDKVTWFQEMMTQCLNLNTASA